MKTAEEPTYAEIQHNLREMEAAINGHKPCAAHDKYLCADCALEEAIRHTREMGAMVMKSAAERIKQRAVVKENFTTQEVNHA